MTIPVPSAVDPREQIVVRAASDPAFRQQLLANPKRTLEQALGITLPASLEVVVFEETPSRICLVVPKLAPAREELSDEALAAVAGGTLPMPAGLPGPLPMPAELPVPMPMPADVPQPMPTPTMLISSLYLTVRR